MKKLLTREQFKEQVFARHLGRCAFCSNKAVDAHHILDRKLWSDGGYYLSNGIAVCDAHHRDCEKTTLTIRQIRASIKNPSFVLPQGFFHDHEYDKWGNPIRPDGTRQPGVLFEDEGCQNMLADGGFLEKFVHFGLTPLLSTPVATERGRLLSGPILNTNCYRVAIYRDYFYAPKSTHRLLGGCFTKTTELPAMSRIECFIAEDFLLPYGMWDEMNQLLPDGDVTDWLSLVGFNAFPPYEPLLGRYYLSNYFLTFCSVH